MNFEFVQNSSETDSGMAQNSSDSHGLNSNPNESEMEIKSN